MIFNKIKQLKEEVLERHHFGVDKNDVNQPFFVDGELFDKLLEALLED